MKAVVQRASSASVSVDGEVIGAFDGPGLVTLIGVTHADTPTEATRLASKIHGLRIFAAESGPEQSASDLDLPILVISQFTLYGETKKGRRPTWDQAAPGLVAEPLIEQVVTELRLLGAHVETGRFGADMQVTFTNDGPFTVLLET